MTRWVLALSATLWGSLAAAGEATVAVAANFLTTAETLAEAFEAETGHRIVITHGSTGQLYAQIVQGAPFDIFLSADEERPARLKEEGRATEVRTYALGRLVLVSRAPVDAATVGEAVAGQTVALADPTVAPYGKAATTAMEKLRLDTATFRPVLVANVGQVATVFVTGNADFAFVSASQLPAMAAPFTMDLAGLVAPIRQDAALLDRAQGNDAARAFWDWLASAAAAGTIRDAGYGAPGA